MRDASVILILLLHGYLLPHCRGMSKKKMIILPAGLEWVPLCGFYTELKFDSVRSAQMLNTIIIERPCIQLDSHCYIIIFGIGIIQYSVLV